MSEHDNPSKPAAEESPEEGHTFRFAIDCRSSHKVVGEAEYRDGEYFDGMTMVFEVRAWSMSAALTKAANLPFEVRMASLIEQELADDAAEAAEGS